MRPKYKVAIEKRVYQTSDEDSLLIAVADVAVQSVTMPETVKETYLEVRDIITQEVVTVIEILSNINKRSVEGRNAYTKKRLQVLGSYTNLVEVDLLRDGKPVQQAQNNLQSNYRILVSRASRRPKADLYAFTLQHPIPCFPLPLRENDTEPLLGIQTLVAQLYDKGNYDLVIDYRIEPVPPLSRLTSYLVRCDFKPKSVEVN